jgi:hypothetical protein
MRKDRDAIKEDGQGQNVAKVALLSSQRRMKQMKCC